jgi:hypothetical protein
MLITGLGTRGGYAVLKVGESILRRFVVTRFMGARPETALNFNESTVGTYSEIIPIVPSHFSAN